MLSLIIEQVAIALIVFAGLVTHMLPTLLAHQRAHPQKSLIIVVNLVPVFGFLAALALVQSSSLTLSPVLAGAQQPVPVRRSAAGPRRRR